MFRIVRVALGHARRRKAMSLAGIALSALMAGAVGVLIGQASRNANRLLMSLRDPAARSVVLRTSDPAHRPLERPVAQVLAGLPGVELAIALPRALSVTSHGLYDPNASAGYVSVDTLAGTLPLRVIAGRQPAEHEVIISERKARAMRMTQPLATGISTDSFTLPIVGTFTVSDAGAISDTLADLAIGPDLASEPYAMIVLLAREPSDVATIVNVASRLIPDRRFVSVEYEPRAAELERTVARAGATNAASLAAVIVSIGALIQIAVALLMAALQRREIARRRALGYTRSDIVVLTAAEAGFISAAGALLGTVVGTCWLIHIDAPIRADQLVATVGFLVILAVLASIPGAISAALQDPARILRVP
jgi:putative ABC transport system permease protein